MYSEEARSQLAANIMSDVRQFEARVAIPDQEAIYCLWSLRTESNLLYCAGVLTLDAWTDLDLYLGILIARFC